jgi:signal transduction histidine kinase
MTPARRWTDIAIRAVLFASLPLVALADLTTGADLGFSPLYAAPVALLAWRYGARAGLAAAVLSGMGWAAASHLNRPDLAPLAAAWNDSVRIAGLVVLAYLLAAVRRTQQALREALTLRDEFLSLVAHEIRAPVAAIEILATGLVRAAGIASDDRRALTRLLQQSGELRALAEDVLAIGRLEAGTATGEVETFDLRVLVWEVAARGDRVDVVDTYADEILVRADRKRIRRALGNIIDNALKFSPADRTVQVTASAARGDALVVVADHGIGIDPADALRIFDKYARADDPYVARTPGVGLGLYLTRLILRASGGDVSVTSPGRGHGATFRMRLPLAATARTVGAPAGAPGV